MKIPQIVTVITMRVTIMGVKRHLILTRKKLKSRMLMTMFF